MAEDNNMIDVINLVRQLDDPTVLDTATIETGTFAAVVPTGKKVVDLVDTIEKQLPNPRRRKGFAAHATVESFVAYVNSYGDANGVENIPVFVRERGRGPGLGVQAIFNHDEGVDGAPGWGDHGATLALNYSEALTEWMDLGNGGHWQSQEDMAQFLEDHVLDLVDVPPMQPADGADHWAARAVEISKRLNTRIAAPAEILALSRELKIYANAKVTTSINRSTGEHRLSFVEEHMDGEGGAADVPGMFLINLPIFAGEDERTPMICRLFYRLKQGGQGVGFKVQILHLKETLKAAKKKVIDELGRASPGDAIVTVYEGMPGESQAALVAPRD